MPVNLGARRFAWSNGDTDRPVVTALEGPLAGGAKSSRQVGTQCSGHGDATINTVDPAGDHALAVPDAQSNVVELMHLGAVDEVIAERLDDVGR